MHQPFELPDFYLEWHRIDRAREAGRIATRELLPQIIGAVQR
jgi:NTE family protein